MFKKLKYGIAAGMAVTLMACTPEQIDYLRQSGVEVSSETEAALLALDDHDLLVGANIVTPEGNVIESRAPSGSRCPQHYNAALNAGWSKSQWSKIDYIMWRESRCKPTAYNGKGRDNSYGLMQLNMKAHKGWVGPIVGWDFTKLYNPSTNLRVAKNLYDRAKKAYGCGFQPWKTTKQRHWCN